MTTNQTPPLGAEQSFARERIKRLSDTGLRHKTGVTPNEYLKAFLAVGREFAYATQDGSWGEFEKELHIMALELWDLKNPAIPDSGNWNILAQTRYDELDAEGKHGHYETLFRVCREQREAYASQQNAKLVSENVLLQKRLDEVLAVIHGSHKKSGRKILHIHQRIRS